MRVYLQDGSNVDITLDPEILHNICLLVRARMIQANARVETDKGPMYLNLSYLDYRRTFHEDERKAG